MSHFDQTTRTWNGPRQPPIINPAASVGQVIVNVLERTPEKVFQICADTGETITCSQLRTRTIRAALYLNKRCNLSKGDMVCMVVNNCSSVPSVLFGCFLLGAPVHTLDPSFEQSDLVNLMGITKPQLIFCNRHNVETVRQSLKQLALTARVMVLDDPETEKLLFDPAEGEKGYRPPYLGDSDKTVALIVCSSGTTSLPKAVCLSHAQLIAPYPWLINLGIDTLLCFSSLYWVSSFQMLMTTLLNGHKRITTAKPFSPAYAFELITKFQVTHVFTPPPMLAELVEYCESKGFRLSSLRIIGCGGSCLPETVRRRANALLQPNGKVYLGYGMSETGGTVSIDLFGKPNSAGVLVANVTVRIAAEATGDLLEPEQEGEIQVRNDHPFAGYYDNERETQALLTTDGFIKTGDIGFFDKTGFLYITDRSKEMLRYRGFQIAPAQLEALLVELPEVSQAVVVGIPHPEPPHVDLATALVEVRGHHQDLRGEEQRLLTLVNEQLPDYKRLRGGLFFVDSLPRTASGKINRREAKRLALELSQLTIDSGLT
ncbi:probable 4-coumarate--CoA ligase 1 [Topomyia yanbarensis]|uniref:probable 4-coumarate--CoA ligase 1 n=1 Tax=Topomyia yanbarensis TaxID=2498891 RepID=UPI00273CC1A8|nr:probable 4-coumarate--CoA ligase 1 [Topomyia yanbarensis]